MLDSIVRLAAFATCILVTGCASVTGGNVQKMYVQTQAQGGTPVTGASCALSNDKGTWRITSPGDTSIVRSNKPMEVRCDKAGEPQGVVSVESATRGAMYGNIILGGVVGAVIDHSSGAAYEYPEIVKVTMGQMIALAAPKPQTTPSNDPSRPRNTPQPTAMQMMEPPASGFARIDDADAVPYLGPKGRAAYRDWAARPAPKAFAVAPGGAYFTAVGLTPQDSTLPSDPQERAVTGCMRASNGATCKLYAINHTVVWAREAAPATAAVVPVTLPAAVAPSAVAPTAIAPAAVVPVAAPAAQPALIATGYARVEDVDAVPYISDNARNSYREWVTKPTPRAFAIAETGHWAATWGVTPADPNAPRDPSERALQVCQQRAKSATCKLYAVNGSVVWARETARTDPARTSP